MNKIDNILDSLKGKQPVIDCEDDFADFIMDAIPEREESRPRRNPIVIALRAVASIAAAIIVGLFIFQNLDDDVEAPAPKIIKANTSGSTIRNVYNHCVSHSNTLSINQLKAKYHEKF